MECEVYEYEHVWCVCVGVCMGVCQYVCMECVSVWVCMVCVVWKVQILLGQGVFPSTGGGYLLTACRFVASENGWDWIKPLAEMLEPVPDSEQSKATTVDRVRALVRSALESAQDNESQALDQLKQALELSPEDENALDMKGAILVRQKKYRKLALASLSKRHFLGCCRQFLISSMLMVGTVSLLLRPRLLEQLDDVGVACLCRDRQGGYPIRVLRIHIRARFQQYSYGFDTTCGSSPHQGSRPIVGPCIHICAYLQ